MIFQPKKKVVEDRIKKSLPSDSSKKSFVTKIEDRLVPELRAKLLADSYQFDTPPYTAFQAKTDGLTCTVYLSGKVVVQGRKTAEFVSFTLSPLTYTPTEAHIGSDEAGKGDFFGPLVIAAAYLGEGDDLKMSELGVRDSKDLSDEQCKRLADQIDALLISHTICLMPETYNRLWARFKNLNRLLAWAHVEALRQVSAKSGCKKALVDQFAHEGVVGSFAKDSELKIEQRTRAESDLAVAAASILARAEFLRSLDRLSKQIGRTLPKGSSDPSVIKTGVVIAKEQGNETLGTVAKSHFKTWDKVQELL